MRRTHVARLRAAGSQLMANYSSIVTPSPITVTAEIAEAVSCRNSRLTQLPSDVAAAIDAAAVDANRKAIRRKGRELTDELKRISRTKHRGGKYPNLNDVLPDYSIARSLRGKRRQKENKALTELAQQHTPLAVEEGETLPESFWDGGERGVTSLLDAITTEAKDGATANAAAGGAMYREDTAAAYAVTRFPACYASLRRVLLEVQHIAPRGWRPESVLDFGAGPGTATWAAHSIWSVPNAVPIQVTAVEPSGAMAWLGQDIQQRLEDAYQKAQGSEKLESSFVTTIEDTTSSSRLPSSQPLPPPPMVRWMSRLSGTRRGKEKKTPPTSGKSVFEKQSSTSRKYDIVIAGYVLSEIATPKQRRRLVSDLWNRTGKYLILVEPGTPVGSDMIQSARSQILGLPQQNSTSTSHTAGASTATSDAVEEKEAHPDPEAYVIAPCPHDGPCPLQGRASWCHFVQRFERTAVQRRAKLIPGKLPPRSHQDERFSYVVLARGSRGQGRKEENNDNEQGVGSNSIFAEQVHVSGTYYETGKEDQDAEEDTTPPQQKGVETGGRKSEKEVIDNDYLNIPANLKPKRMWLDDENEMSSNEDFSELEEIEEEDGEDDNDINLEATEIELRRLLLDSLANENDDDDEEESVDQDGDGSRQLPPELEEVLQRSLDELRKKKKKTNTMSTNDAKGYESESEEESDEVEEDTATAVALQKFAVLKTNKGVSGPEAEEAARKSSSAWSRILRPPRKRSGHVVLDLCSAIGVDGNQLHGLDGNGNSGGDGGGFGNHQRPRGILIRQIVSKGKATREVGGTAPFKLARRAAWGDLWPLDYQRKMKSFYPPVGGDANGTLSES